MTLNERFKVDESRTDKKSDLGQKSESDVSILFLNIEDSEGGELILIMWIYYK